MTPGGLRLKISRLRRGRYDHSPSKERSFREHEYVDAMSLSTALLVVVVWTTVAIVAGLWIAKLLRRRGEEAQVPRSENFRNSA